MKDALEKDNICTYQSNIPSLHKEISLLHLEDPRQYSSIKPMPHNLFSSANHKKLLGKTTKLSIYRGQRDKGHNSYAKKQQPSWCRFSHYCCACYLRKWQCVVHHIEDTTIPVHLLQFTVLQFWHFILYSFIQPFMLSTAVILWALISIDVTSLLWQFFHLV